MNWSTTAYTKEIVSTSPVRRRIDGVTPPPASKRYYCGLIRRRRSSSTLPSRTAVTNDRGFRDGTPGWLLHFESNCQLNLTRIPRTSDQTEQSAHSGIAIGVGRGIVNLS